MGGCFGNHFRPRQAQQFGCRDLGCRAERRPGVLRFDGERERLHRRTAERRLQHGCEHRPRWQGLPGDGRSGRRFRRVLDGGGRLLGQRWRLPGRDAVWVVYQSHGQGRQHVRHGVDCRAVRLGLRLAGQRLRHQQRGDGSQLRGQRRYQPRDRLLRQCAGAIGHRDRPERQRGGPWLVEPGDRLRSAGHGHGCKPGRFDRHRHQRQGHGPGLDRRRRPDHRVGQEHARDRQQRYDGIGGWRHRLRRRRDRVRSELAGGWQRFPCFEQRFDRHRQQRERRGHLGGDRRHRHRRAVLGRGGRHLRHRGGTRRRGQRRLRHRAGRWRDQRRDGPQRGDRLQRDHGQRRQCERRRRGDRPQSEGDRRRRGGNRRSEHCHWHRSGGRGRRQHGQRDRSARGR